MVVFQSATSYKKYQKILEGLIWYSLIFTWWSQYLNVGLPWNQHVPGELVYGYPGGGWLQLMHSELENSWVRRSTVSFFFGGGGGELPEKLQWDGNIMGYYDIIWEWDQPTILGWFGWMFLEGHQPPFRGTQILIHTKQLESNKLRVCYGIHGHLERWFTFKKMVMCHRYVRRVAKVGHATGDLEGWDTTKSLLTWRFEFIGFCVYMYLTCI